MSTNTWIVALLMLVMSGSPALAQAPVAAEPNRPRPPLVYYPEEARQTDKPGVVLLGCDVLPNNTLKKCNAVAETPVGFGFGRKAVEITSLVKLRPDAYLKSAAMGGRYALEIIFQTKDQFAPTPAFVPGADAVVLTKAPNGPGDALEAAITCFDSTAKKHCRFHRLDWKKKPDLTTMLWVNAARGPATGVGVVVCQPGADGGLARCIGSDDATTAYAGPFVSAFTAASTAEDQTPLSAGPIAIAFDWAAIHTAAMSLKFGNVQQPSQ